MCCNRCWTILLAHTALIRFDSCLLGLFCLCARELSLLFNPVTKRQYYRLYVIHKVPSLRVLDFCKIKDKV